MKKLLLSSVGVPLLAIFAMGCADSGQGGAADNESGVVTSPAPLIDPSEPGVASEPGTTPTTSTNYVHETPARPVQADPATTTQPAPTTPPSANPDTGAQPPQPDLNQQGAQQSPEPLTGDDANPDNINPRP